MNSNHWELLQISCSFTEWCFLWIGQFIHQVFFLIFVSCLYNVLFWPATMSNWLQVVIILATSVLERLCQALLTLLFYSFTECILNNVHMELACDDVASYCYCLWGIILNLWQNLYYVFLFELATGNLGIVHIIFYSEINHMPWGSFIGFYYSH